MNKSTLKAVAARSNSVHEAKTQMPDHDAFWRVGAALANVRILRNSLDESGNFHLAGEDIRYSLSVIEENLRAGYDAMLELA